MYTTIRNTFAPIAFELGLFVQLEKLENYLEHCSFLKNEKQDYRNLRKKYSKKILSKKEKEKIKTFSKELLEISKSGLLERGYEEEKYLIIDKELN